MATLKMSGCMKLVSKMSDADQDALLQRLDQYQADGVPAERAQFMAAQDMLAEIQGERDSLFGLLQEQHPDLFTVSEEATPAEEAPAVQLSRARTSLGFYSALAESVDGIKTNSAPAQGWKDAIKGLVNKGQVKADEVEWSGVNDWLDLQQGKVTKEQIAEYLEQGGVKVEETVLGESMPGRDLDGWLDRWADKNPGTATARAINQGLSWDEIADVAKDDNQPAVQRLLANQANPAKYGQYTLPGGENYREVLLRLPERGSPKMDGGQISFSPEENAAQNYRSSHWDQPNVLAHIRLNDRTDADGNKVLFVEELQSDWGQEGKKKGFADPSKKPVSRKEFDAYVDKLLDDYIEQQVQAGEDRQWAGRRGINMPLPQMAEELGRSEEYARMREGRDMDMSGEAGIPAAPFVNKTEGWLNLALKRVMVMAAEGEYDKVAFVNGEQSADRYDLSKQVDSVYITKLKKGGFEFTARKDGREIIIRQTVPDENSLAAAVGKDLAEKANEQELDSGKSYSGLDLKVGGEGMKTFYDKIVPLAVNKLLPKVGGGQVVAATIDVQGRPESGTGLQERREYQGPTLGVFEIRAVADDPNLPSAIQSQLNEVADLVRRGQSIESAMQQAGSISAAQALGGDMVPLSEVPSQQLGFNVTEAMRAKLEEGVPMFSRARPSVGVGRDELGYTNFGVGAMAYERASTIANNVLDALSNKTGGMVAFKPIDLKLNRAIRKMRVELEKTQNLTANVAQQLNDIPEDERQMISDVIEGELKVGVVPPQRVLQMAASMSQIMSQQSAELVRLGMLTPEAAQRWENKYLPRFYEQKLGDEVKAWAKAAKSLFGKTRAMAGIRGNNLKARGMFETVDVADLPAWQAQGWEIRDADYDPATSTDVRVWRDFTRDERDNMGEIRDAMFRFVMGYMNSQRDVALGRLYERLEADVASRTEKPGYVLVPKTLVEDTVARRYGKLAGKWVPREVMDHLSALDSSTDNEVFQLYKKGLAKWKEGKTVLNPVAHANNIISNLTMAHFAGVSYWDAGKYAGATRDLMRNSVLVTEAKDAGLFGGTFNRAELVDELPPQLRMLAGMTESKLAKGGNLVWNALSFFLNKPLGKAYDAEDKFFRFLIYREARGRGLDIDDAVDYAQRFIFTYDNLPKGARAVRDFGLPFFGYTYKVLPVLAQTALEHPLRMAAPMAALSAINAAMYALAAGLGDGDDWDELLKRYVTDPEFRKRAQELEADERKNLPEWMRGRTALGTQKTIRLGEDTVTGLPMFLDVSRMVPAGDIFDVNNQAGGIPIPAPFTPNNPVLTTLYAMMANKDTFKGKDIVNQKLDTNAEAAEKRAEWIWRQFAPAIAVGNYHFDRTMDAIANATGKPIDLGLGEYTGVGRDGLPVQPGLAALQTIGIKARPIDLDLSERMNRADRERIIKDLQSQIRQLDRLEGRGAITPETAEQKRELQRDKIQRVREGLTVEGEPIK